MIKLTGIISSTEFIGGQVVGMRGLKGDKGDKGDTGAQGIQGIQGIQGPKGDKGDKGDTGEQGPKGDTGLTGPKGDKGDQGPKGDKGDKGNTGDTGATPNFSIGTVETLDPEEDATATITGTAENPVLSLGIPKGDTGDVSLAQLQAVLPTETASGSIATFDDGNGVVPCVSVKADINPIQDLHGYDHPWVGGAGKNKLPLNPAVQSTSNNGITFTVQNDGTILCVGTATTTTYKGFSYYNGNGSDAFDLTPYIGETVTLSINSSDAVIHATFTYFKEDGTYVNFRGGADVTNSLTVTIPSDAVKARFLFRINQGVSVNGKAYITMAIGSESTYEPYENICPISGYDEVSAHIIGINQWDEEWEKGSIDTNTGANIGNNNMIRSKNYISVFPNTTYYHTQRLQMHYYDENKTLVGVLAFANAGTFTTPANAKYVRFAVTTNYGTVYNNDISINYPSTNHNYNPYQGRVDVTAEFDNTVYGGTVDLVSGLLTVDRRLLVLNGTESTYDSSTSSGVRYFTVSNLDPLSINTNASNPVLYSNIFKSATGVTVGNAYVTGGGSILVFVLPQDITTSEQAHEFFASQNAQFVIPLATPQTYQLTPQQIQTLLGTNNVWSDGGDVEVTYKADIQLWVNKKTDELNVAILALSQ